MNEKEKELKAIRRRLLDMEKEWDEAFYDVPVSSRNADSPRVNALRKEMNDLKDKAKKLTEQPVPLPKGFSYGHPSYNTVSYGMRLLPSPWVPVSSWGVVVPFGKDFDRELDKLGYEKWQGSFLMPKGVPDPNFVRYAAPRDFVVAPKRKGKAFRAWVELLSEQTSERQKEPSSGYSLQDEWDNVINNYADYSGRSGVVSIIEKSGLTRDTKDMLIARLDAKIAETQESHFPDDDELIKLYGKNLDKDEIIAELMKFVPKDSEFYGSTAKNLSALHRYELRDSLVEMRRQQGGKKQPSLSELQSIEESRSPASRAADESRSNLDTISPDSPRVARWLRDPGSADIEGVDTPRKHKKVKAKKKSRGSSQSTTLGRMR